MHTLDTDEIAELAEQLNIRVLSTEIDTVRDFVNENLAGLDAVEQVRRKDEPEAVGERKWWVPEDNPHNGIVTRCAVPPRNGRSPILSGKTVGVKDIIAVAGVPMQCGSASMAGYVPGFDATVIERIRDHGGSIVAKTNLDEFAGGARGISHFGQMTNPYDDARIPGGSSGGSAIAVATGAVDVALGTDTGGSVRMPSSHCGLVGLKPSYGLVPLTGVVENTYSLDHVGPMTRTVEDSAKVLESIAGKDPTDPASMAAAGHDGYGEDAFLEAVETPPDVGDIRLGIVTEGFDRNAVDQAIIEQTRTTVDRVHDQGCSIEDVSIESFEESGVIKQAISYVELAANWRDAGAPVRRSGSIDPDFQIGFAARSRTKSQHVGQYYRARLLAGAYLLEEDHGRTYTTAMAAKQVITNAFSDAMQDVDVLVYPTMAGMPPSVEDAANPGMNYARNTRPANVTGQPAITVPNGEIDAVPTGLQLVADHFEDAHLLGCASAIESVIAE